MKNFPHQINQIPKLVGALEVIDTLIQGNHDVSDDGVYGYGLARAHIYTFRNHTETDNLEERIALEQRKKKSDQGARTCARDLRRLFLLLGFIDVHNNDYTITEVGRNIINAGCDVSRELVKNLWRYALNDLQIQDYGQASHPYRILLTLVRENPGVNISKLALALEAENDSEGEILRVIEISRSSNWTDLISATTAQLRNAVKILPSLAKQIEDINVISDACYITHSVDNEEGNVITEEVELENNSTDVSNSNIITEVTEGQYNTGRNRHTRRSRQVSADEIATIPTMQDDETSNDSENNSVDLSNAIRTRAERTARHHGLVRCAAEILERNGYRFYENPMDCLGVKESFVSLLIEVKTLNGAIDDEIKQVRLALGQLTYYEHFSLTEDMNAHIVQKIALFESKISDEHIEYLEYNECLVMWFEGEQLCGSTSALQLISNEDIVL